MNLDLNSRQWRYEPKNIHELQRTLGHCYGSNGGDEAYLGTANDSAMFLSSLDGDARDVKHVVDVAGEPVAA